MADVKFTASNGQWTISYEGNEDFLKQDLLPTLEMLLQSRIWGISGTAEQPVLEERGANDGPNTTPASGSIPQMTLNNLCAKLNTQTGPDLVIAACTFMTYIGGQDTLPRRDILQTMKTATRYYKDTFGSNLSSYLATLVKQGKLMERSQEVYLLSPAFAREMENALA